MKFIEEDNLQYSPSDLTSFISCEHLIWKDFKTLQKGESIPQDTEDSYSHLLKNKGKKHESAVFTKLQKEFPDHVSIPDDKSVEDRFKLTVEEITKGTSLIYQAVLKDGQWIGYADFLIQSSTPSDLGQFSYEVFDTKLAKSPKPEHIIQICAYSEFLGKIQGVLPVKMHLILGDNTQEDYSLSDFIAYYVHLKKRFESFLNNPPEDSYPEPCRHCDVCHWQKDCTMRWKKDNHLSLIANITRSQRDKITQANLSTVTSFANSDQTTKLSNLNQDVRMRLQSQAKLQLEKYKSGKDKYELLSYSTGKGLERLPKPSDGDVFFDIEGDPLYDNGLEYLLGVFYLDNNEGMFKYWWSHNHDEEKQSFTEFMEFLQEHLAMYPSAHIYHYNHYETTSLKRLAAQHGIKEEQLDNLLRNRRFVDLYTVARESIRTSESGFSLKNLEVFYMEKRDGVINSADVSVIYYNRWRECEDPQLLQNILDYNKTDCKSTYMLRQWLLTLKQDGSPWMQSAPIDDPEETKEPKDWEVEYEVYKAKLLAVSEENRELGTIVAQLLEFHRRESKVEWWETYARQDKFIDELIDDLNCMADLSLLKKPIAEKRSWLYTYQFPPQEYRLRRHNTVVNVETLDNAGTIFDIDDNKCQVILKIGNKQHSHEGLPPHFSIGPKNPINYDLMRNAIYRFADSILENTSEYQSTQDFLSRSIPRIKHRKSGEPIIATNDLLKATKEAVINMEDSCLTIQGPPGTGKTYISSHVIVELLRQGKKVGISSNSHEAIHVILKKVEEIALEHGFDFVGVKKASGNLPETYYHGINKKSKSIFNLDKPGDVDTVINNEFDEDDEDKTYNGNVIPLGDGKVLSFDTSTPLQRARVWKLNQTRSAEEIEDEREDAPEGVEKTSLEEPLLRFATLFAGTAWLFSRPRFNQQLDYLFIDEAGQVALANVVAMGTSAKNIVLIGDQMQLPQPTRGIHPGEAGTSALEFLMLDHPTIPPDRGIFLDITRRLHPEICEYISKVFYQGRLRPHPLTAKRSLTIAGSSLPSTGILFIASEHTGCSQKSTEEGLLIGKYYSELLKQHFQDVESNGKVKPIKPVKENDILVVTPYNIQLNHLTNILPQEAKVGTVDKFQGQEEQIVMVSMVTSTKEESPRNMEFLYSRNRLNVALSRAKCLSIVVFNPSLLGASCSTVEQMKLLNAFCWLEQYAKKLE